MVWLEIDPAVFYREKAILGEEIIEREIRRESVLAVDHDELRRWQRFDVLQEFARRNAFPEVVELTPARHAVHVRPHLHTRQGEELVVPEGLLALHEAENAQVPGLRMKLRRRTGVQDGPLFGERLAGRQALGAQSVGADYGVAHDA